ncbi:hypothetical protein IGI04_040011 [Brassica rapa subsp. trilocularis]|uniref:Secreted protein n=1 Tax=Brassica rapa subsp. trilocularis TaxID=1813537 RepID=A0ABQ7KPG5_BRACM|nr:hypothetical protein IGI04_040011 [Brassica rapa subsp. trilocularis]
MPALMCAQDTTTAAPRLMISLSYLWHCESDARPCLGLSRRFAGWLFSQSVGVCLGLYEFQVVRLRTICDCPYEAMVYRFLW